MNTVTLLGSEIVGRAYGGGLLKHEPREADLLPVPSMATLAAAHDELQLLKPQLAVIMRQNNLSRAVALLFNRSRIPISDLTCLNASTRALSD